MNKKRLLTMMGSYAPYPGVYVYDKFTDANGTSLDAHILDKPKQALWVEDVGTWDIQSNQANVVAISGFAQAILESGKADCTISVIAKSVVALDNCYVIFRYVDINNYLYFYINNTRNAVAFTQKVATVTTNLFLGGVDSFPIATGSNYLLKVVLLGNTVKFYVDNVLTIDTTNNNFLTATKHGIAAEKVTAKFDDFQIT